MLLTLARQHGCYQPWVRGRESPLDLDRFSARIQQTVHVTEGEGMKTLVHGQTAKIRSTSQLKFVEVLIHWCVCVPACVRVHVQYTGLKHHYQYSKLILFNLMSYYR